MHLSIRQRCVFTGVLSCSATDQLRVLAGRAGDVYWLGVALAARAETGGHHTVPRRQRADVYPGQSSYLLLLRHVSVYLWRSVIRISVIRTSSHYSCSCYTFKCTSLVRVWCIFTHVFIHSSIHARVLESCCPTEHRRRSLCAEHAAVLHSSRRPHARRRGATAVVADVTALSDAEQRLQLTWRPTANSGSSGCWCQRA